MLIFYRFRDIVIYWWKISLFSPLLPNSFLIEALARVVSLAPMLCQLVLTTCHGSLQLSVLQSNRSQHTMEPDIGQEWPTAPAFDVPVRWSPSECFHDIWCGKTRMVWLPYSGKILKIRLFVLTKYTNVTDGRIDRHRMTA